MGDGVSGFLIVRLRIWLRWVLLDWYCWRMAVIPVGFSGAAGVVVVVDGVLVGVSFADCPAARDLYFSQIVVVGFS